MKPEKILYAMNDIDAAFLSEARETAPACHHSRKFVALIAAVIALMAVTATAFAAEEIAGWFRQYFDKQVEAPLTPGQIDYIKENEQIIMETQENNGWSVELKSAIGSSRITYITLSITAPEDVALSEWESLTYFRLTDGQGNSPYTYYSRMMDDADGFDHTCDILMVAEPREVNDTGYWNIQVDKLYGEIYNEEYERELLRTKYAEYADQQDIPPYTSEEQAKILQKTLLAEGPWHFTVEVSDLDISEIELITEPIKSNVLLQVRDSFEYNGKSARTVEPVVVTSFLLRPLDASLYYSYIKDRELFWPVMFTGTHATVIMNDGAQIPLRGSFASRDGELKLLADSPIILEEVDHVLLSDGTKLMVP